MAKISPQQWREVSPLLDHALSLSEKEREAWLQSLNTASPESISLLRLLLEEHRALVDEHFLEVSPNPPGNEAHLQGQNVGPYTLISVIGVGGMGRVWLAERSDGRFKRRVAVKFLQFSVATRAGAERFKREGRILGSLSHPHIAELIDAGVMPDGQPYMVLEYVEGEPIDEYCDAHSFDVNARIRLFLDVLSALGHAHANLIVHRDIKPSNVLVNAQGQVKLLDFGIAKLLAPDAVSAASVLTIDGSAALTPYFAAPEQITGAAVTTATDIYAAGVLLYVLLAGQHPLGPGSHSTADLVKGIVDFDPPPPSDAIFAGKPDAEATHMTAIRRKSTPAHLRRRLRGDLDTIVMRALKKSPEERYSSVSALADDLRRYLKHEPIAARPDTLPYRVRKYVRRHPTGVAAAAVLVLMLAGFAAVQAVQLRRITRERDRANRIAQFMTDMFKVSDPTEVHPSDVPAREILDRASKNIEDGLTQDPVLRAQLMHVMGNVYKNLNQFPRAQFLLQGSLDLSRRELGPTDPETLSAMDDLAWVLGQEGQTGSAEQLQRQALAMERSHLGLDRPETLTTMNDLAATLATEGRFVEAEKLWRETLDRERRIFGIEDHRTLATMDNLSVVLGQEGHFADSEQLGRQTWELDRRALGPENLLTLGVADNLAETLIFMHRDEEAEQILRGNLDIVLRIVGPKHSETALIRYDLARIAAHTAQRDQSFTLLRQAIENGLSPMMLRGVGSDHELDSLHSDPRWRSILLTAEKRLTATQKTN